MVQGERDKLARLQEELSSLAMTFREAEDYLLGLELFGMRFGLDRMHKLMTVLGHAAAALRVDPRGRLEREVVDGADDRGDPRAPRAAHGVLHLAAPAHVRGADRGGRSGRSPSRRSPTPSRARRMRRSSSTGRSTEATR